MPAGRKVGASWDKICRGDLEDRKRERETICELHVKNTFRKWLDTQLQQFSLSIVSFVVIAITNFV